MSSANNTASGFRLPILQGVLPIDAARIPTELIAGLTLAALAIPEVMGYTKIAGTPVIFGLYTILIPMALFALFGSSRHLVVAQVLDDVEEQSRYELRELFGEDAFYDTLEDVMKDYQQHEYRA
jgi:hypothetical protein